jgi:hypothetical protein
MKFYMHKHLNHDNSATFNAENWKHQKRTLYQRGIKITKNFSLYLCYNILKEYSDFVIMNF